MVYGLVLASGYGTRLRGYIDIPKYFIELFGRPLIEYPIYSLCRSGVEKTFIIVNEYVKPYLESSGLVGRYNLDVIVNPHPEWGNGFTLLYALRSIGGEVLVSVADHIYPPTLPSLLSISKGDIVVAGDSMPKYVDVDEATKIYVSGDGRLVRIGKDLESFSYVDMGVFKMRADSVTRYASDLWGRESSLSEVVEYVANQGGKVYVKDFTGFPWRDVDVPSDVEFVASPLFKKIVSKYFGWV